MGEAYLDYKKGGAGFDINGIIKDYYVYAGETVNVGDFVEFVNGVAFSDEVRTKDTSIAYEALNGMSAVRLSNTSIFIAYDYGTSLKGVVCTVQNGVITPGTVTFLGVNGVTIFSVASLSSTSIFVAYGMEDDLYGVVATISGTTITKGSNTYLGVNTSGIAMSAVALSSTSVFIAYSTGTGMNTIPYGMVCTISGTAITKGTGTQISSSSYSALNLSVAKLSSTKVVVVHTGGSNGTNLKLYGTVCTISGTKITRGTNTQISTVSYSGNQFSAVALTSQYLFIAHSYYSNGYFLYGIVCAVSGTNLYVYDGTDTQLCSLTSRNEKVSVCIIDHSKVFVAHGYDSTNFYLRGLLCNISGTTTTPGTDIELSNTINSGAMLSAFEIVDNSVFVAHTSGSSKTLYGQVFNVAGDIPTNQFGSTEYETQVRVATTLPCNGVASTSGIGGSETAHNQQVSVYVPELEVT